MTSLPFMILAYFKLVHIFQNRVEPADFYYLPCCIFFYSSPSLSLSISTAANEVLLLFICIFSALLLLFYYAYLCDFCFASNFPNFLSKLAPHHHRRRRWRRNLS